MFMWPLGACSSGQGCPAHRAGYFFRHKFKGCHQHGGRDDGYSARCWVAALPPGFWYPGKEIRIESKGVYTTPLLASELTLRVKLGSVTLSSILTSALVTSGSRESYVLQGSIVCETIGVSGMVRVGGNINYQGPTGRIFDNLDSLSDTATVDTTVASDVDVTVQWDAATASRLVRINTFTVESLG